MKKLQVSVAGALVRGGVGAHGFYFVTAAASVVAASHAFAGPGLLIPVAAVWWIAALHELGHAFAALAFRMKVRRCFATPWFGRTTITHGNRALEFGVVALVGPLAGMGAAALVHVFATAPAFGGALGAAGQRWLMTLAWLGAAESVFNLLPVHRLLDGRVALRSFRRGLGERALLREEQRMLATRPVWARPRFEPWAASAAPRRSPDGLRTQSSARRSLAAVLPHRPAPGPAGRREVQWEVQLAA